MSTPYRLWPESTQTPRARGTRLRRRIGSLVLTLAATVGLIGCGGGPTGNLITNTGFERDRPYDAPSDWIEDPIPALPFSVFRIEDRWSSSGSQALRITAQKSDSTSVSLSHARPNSGHTVPIRAGQTYHFRAAWKILDSSEGPPTPGSRLGLSLDFLDADGAVTAFNWDNFAGRTGHFTSDLTGEAPDNTSQVLLNIAVSATKPNDKIDFYVDDLSFDVGGS
jgi:hypothetical protein